MDLAIWDRSRTTEISARSYDKTFYAILTRNLKHTEMSSLNSLWSSDAIWRRRSGSTLAEVMAWCLSTPSHYLNHRWLFISKVQLPSPDGNIHGKYWRYHSPNENTNITHLKSLSHLSAYMGHHGTPWWRHQMGTFSALLALCAGIHRLPVNSPHEGPWRGALMFSLICAWTNDWVNNRDTGD